jgi:hypothetical protein
MMKKAILFIFSALTIGSVDNAVAQTFTMEKDTSKVAVFGYGEAHNKLTNATSGPLNIQWKIKSHTLPASWVTNGFGICDNATCINFTTPSAIANGVYDADPLAASLNMDMKLQIDLSAIPTTGGPYYITATATDKDNPTNTEDFTYEIYNKFGTAVANVVKSNDDIVMYPNPARSELNVLFDGNAGIKNITVYNLIGKAVTVYKVAGNSASLDITGIPSGIYFIRLVDAHGHVVATRKFTHQ